MRISQTLGPPVHSDPGDPGANPSALEAEIIEVTGATVRIVIPAFSGQKDYSEVPYVAPAGGPQVGDRAVAVFVDDRSPWAIVPGHGITDNASATVKGLTKLSSAPTDPNNPIAAGTNDPRIPTQAENDALAGTSGSPANSNRFVTNADPRNSDARTPLAHTHPQTDITGLIAALAAKLGVSLFDAAGDLLIGNGPDAVDVLSALGAADGDVLTRDSTDPLGVIWAPGSGGGSGGSEPDASATVKGVSKLSVAPASAINPIAAGTNDPRLSDTRTPTDGSVTAAKVASSLKPSGAAAAGDEALRALGTTGATAAAGNDSRLSDTRTPTDGSVTAAKVAASLKPSGSAAATDESLRRLGTGSTHAAAGDDARFPTTGQKNALTGSSGTPGSGNTYVTDQDPRNSDARTPTAHTHPQSDVTGLAASLAAKQDTSAKGQPSGYAALDAAGKVSAPDGIDFGTAELNATGGELEALNALVARGVSPYLGFEAADGRAGYLSGAGWNQYGILVADLLLSGALSTDSAARFQALVSGALAWGPGNAALDVLLERSAAAALTLTGALNVTGALTKGGVAAVLTNDARLSDARTPTDGSVTAAKVAASLKPSGSAVAADEALRALGTTAATAAAGNDSRLSDTRTPTDASVTLAKLAAALKPSGSAAAADEAVRALGSGASQAAPGNHISTYRTLLDASGSHTAAKVAGTYGMGQGDPIAVTGTGILYPLNVIYIAAADFQTVAGVAPKLRIRGQVYVNDVAPTGNFTFGLHPVTRPATSGAAGLVIYTIGAAISGSTAAINTPAADSSNVATGADFALPADGHYVIGVVTTATVAASSHLHLSAVLQMRNA